MPMTELAKKVYNFISMFVITPYEVVMYIYYPYMSLNRENIRDIRAVPNVCDKHEVRLAHVSCASLRLKTNYFIFCLYSQYFRKSM